MIHTGLDLPQSLSVCEQLATDWDQTSCDGGVFMENFNSSYGVTSRFLRKTRSRLSLQRRGGTAQALLLPPGDVRACCRRRTTTGSRPRRPAPASRRTGAPRASSPTDETPRESRASTGRSSCGSAASRSRRGGPSASTAQSVTSPTTTPVRNVPASSAGSSRCRCGRAASTARARSSPLSMSAPADQQAACAAITTKYVDACMLREGSS